MNTVASKKIDFISEFVKDYPDLEKVLENEKVMISGIGPGRKVYKTIIENLGGEVVQDCEIATVCLSGNQSTENVPKIRNSRRRNIKIVNLEWLLESWFTEEKKKKIEFSPLIKKSYKRKRVIYLDSDSDDDFEPTKKKCKYSEDNAVIVID